MKQRKINWMKPIFLFGMIGLLCGLFACTEKEPPAPELYQVKVKLVYPGDYPPKAGVTVKLENSATGTIFEEPTDAEGMADFEVTAGNYNVTAGESRVVGMSQIVFNGVLSNQVISADRIIELPLLASETHQIIIKELYNGGCQKDDGSGAWNNDAYVILYNNSGEPASLANACLGMALPYNSQGTNNDYKDGVLFYETEGWVPAGTGIWTFENTVTLAPGQQLVIALKNAIDHTPTYSNSVNLNNAAYYCTYDPEIYPNASQYLPPGTAIPTSHYLKAYHYGTGNAWPLSTSSPAFFVFIPEGMTPAQLAADESLNNLYNNLASQVRKKIPTSWVIDAIEVYNYGNTSNSKRMTAAVDAGYVELFNAQGFTLYRNVDKAATEAIPENEGKIVYGYSLGTQGVTIGEAVINGTTDSSGIDAEASIKQGARIVYKNTNNSSNDFHQRSRASLRN